MAALHFKYIKKEEALIDYLTKNSEDKINLTKVATIKVGPDSIVIPGPLNVLFVVNEQGITADVINIHTIKPLDEAAILNSVAKTNCIVTAEEHNILGGLGESVARVLAKNNPTPQEFVATQDTFGESGTPAQLMEKYGLNASAIVNATQRVLRRK